MDVSETDKEIEVTAELPGVEERDVQINLSDNLLTIRGEKKAEKEQKDKNYRLVERSYGSFERTFELPEGVSPDAIKANIAKGVLKGDNSETGACAGQRIRGKICCVTIGQLRGALLRRRTFYCSACSLKRPNFISLSGLFALICLKALLGVPTKICKSWAQTCAPQ